MQTVSYLVDAEPGGAQEEGCLHEEHLIDIVDDGAPGDLAHYAGKIDIGYVELRCIEAYRVFFGKVLRQESHEAYEDFLYALGHVTLLYCVVLHILYLKQEDSIEHLEYLSLIDMVGVQVVYYLAHLLRQPVGCIMGHGDYGLV